MKKAREKWLMKGRRENEEQEYHHKRKEAHKIIRKKKKLYIKNVIESVEEDQEYNNTRKMYQTINQFKKGYQHKFNMIGNRKGGLAMNTKERAEIRKVYFDKLLNTEEPKELIKKGNREINEVEVEGLTVEDVKKAMRNLKNNKAIGTNGIDPELIKYGRNKLLLRIYELVRLIWEEERIHEEWKETIIVPIYKKGDRDKCENYRGITFGNAAYKILVNIILEKIKPYIETITGDYQNAFRYGRSVIDNIFILKIINKEIWECNQGVQYLFIDFQKAYDYVRRDMLWKWMEEVKIPKKLINICKTCV